MPAIPLSHLSWGNTPSQPKQNWIYWSTPQSGVGCGGGSREEQGLALDNYWLASWQMITQRKEDFWWLWPIFLSGVNPGCVILGPAPNSSNPLDWPQVNLPTQEAQPEEGQKDRNWKSSVRLPRALSLVAGKSPLHGHLWSGPGGTESMSCICKQL